MLHMNKVNKKLRNAGFSFHHEAYTDEVAVSLLSPVFQASRLIPPSANDTKIPEQEDENCHKGQNHLKYSKVGLDLGQCNIVTIGSSRGGEAQVHSHMQRNFESGLYR